MTRYLCLNVLSLLLVLSAWGLLAQENGVTIPSETLTYDGFDRTYVIHVPVNYDDSQPTPLVVVLHGAGDRGYNMMTVADLPSKADEAGYILVFPDSKGCCWNYLDGQVDEAGDIVDDLGFIVALIDHLSEEYTIDQGRIYALGFSRGGLMAFRLRCALPDRLAGVIVVGASMTYGLAQECLSTQPLSAMVVLGTEDAVFPWQGNVEIEDGVLISSFSMAQTISFLNSLNSCDSTPGVMGIITIPESPMEAFLVDYNDCAENTNSVFVRMSGVGHQWPFWVVVVNENGELGDTNDVFWLFFEAHVRN